MVVTVPVDFVPLCKNCLPLYLCPVTAQQPKTNTLPLLILFLSLVVLVLIQAKNYANCVRAHFSRLVTGMCVGVCFRVLRAM